MILLRQKPERSQLWKQTYPSGKVAERLYHAEGQLHQVKFDDGQETGTGRTGPVIDNELDLSPFISPFISR